MRKILLSTCLVLLAFGLTAQEQRPKNGLFLNVAGDVSILSINYERLFELKEGFYLSGKIGVGNNEEFSICFYCSNREPDKKFVTFPHHITANWGEKTAFFELGLGGTYVSGDNYGRYFIYPQVGFRLFPLRSDRLYFRIYGYLPVSGLDDEEFLISPVGLNVGIIFD